MNATDWPEKMAIDSRNFSGEKRGFLQIDHAYMTPWMANSKKPYVEILFIFEVISTWFRAKKMNGRNSFFSKK